MSGDGLFWHQYMTNVLAPYSESKSIYNGYKQAGILETPISFIIPIYNNMPEIPTESPNINQASFVDDNTRVYCNATNVNIRTGPSTSYEIITTVSKEEQMTRIKKGIQTGDSWDKVKLSNGIIGFIYQTYVTELPLIPPEPEKIEVTGITIDQKEIYMLVGDTAEINCKIQPENATDKTIIYETTNEQIATIDEAGKITANNVGIVTVIAKSNENSNIKEECTIHVITEPEKNEIIFDKTLTINGLEISGIDYTQNTVSYIKQLITTAYEIEIVNNKGEILKDTDLIGTGSNIKFKDNGEIVAEYHILLYGDIDGDGKISSVDLLVLQRHILEIERIGEVYKNAANINRNPKGPSSVDLLLIQRLILELQIIIQ